MTCRVAVAQLSTGPGVTEAAVPGRLRVLLASLDAGGGHAALRDSLARALTLPGAAPERFQVLRWDSGHRLTDRVYRIVVHYIPWLQGVAYRATESPAVVHVFTQGLPGLLHEAAATLQAFRPDIVVTTHFLIELAFARARRRLGVAVRLVSAIPDYGIPARGLVPDADGVRSDAVIVMAEETCEHVVGRCGLPRARVHLSGFIPREPFDRAATVARAQPARRAARAAILTGLRAECWELATLDPARPVVLFLGGSAWTRKTWPVLAGLLACRDGLERLNVIVVCGRDARFEAFLRARGVARPGVAVLGAITPAVMAPLMALADWPVLGSLAPATMQELLHVGCGPLFVHQIIPGTETPHVPYLERNGLGIYEPRPAAMLELLRQATGLDPAGDRIMRLLAGFADRAAAIRRANERRATELGGFLARIATRPEADVPASMAFRSTLVANRGS
jgi:UDP-N-acetylglucosamine:LPS N-acetylglucosamine transferase